MANLPEVREKSGDLGQVSPESRVTPEATSIPEVLSAEGRLVNTTVFAREAPDGYTDDRQCVRGGECAVLTVVRGEERGIVLISFSASWFYRE